jgi:SAM-dependent methyltransferase
MSAAERSIDAVATSSPVPTALDPAMAVELLRRERLAYVDGAAAYQALAAGAGPLRAALLDLVRLEPGLTLLDVCTGPGWIALDAAARHPGVRAHGIDLSPAMIEIARAAALDCGVAVEFSVMDATGLDFDDEAFDRVTCGMGLMHVPDPGGALREMARVVRPGAVLALSVWGRSDETFHGIFADALRDIAGGEVALDYGYLTRLGDPAELHELLCNSGWSPETTTLIDSALLLPDALPLWQQMATGGTTYASLISDLAPERQLTRSASAWARRRCSPTAPTSMKQRWLRPIFTGEEIWCQLFSEPGAGSDVAGRCPPGRARRRRVGRQRPEGVDDARPRLDFGDAGGPHDPDAPKHKGMSYFVLDMHAPGVDVRPLRQITGEAEFNEVFFTDVRIPDERCSARRARAGTSRSPR